MSFLAPGALALLALLPVVVALHAFRSGRHRTASLFLWRKVAAAREGTSAGRRIPWRQPRLWLHLAIVTATVLALAGPTGGGGDLVEHRIVLLDASHAMRAKDVEPTRFDASLAWLRRTIERAPERQVLTIVRVGHEATLVAARHPPDAELAARVAGLRPDDTTPAWGDAVAFAAAVSNPAEATQVQIVSTGETRDAIDAALRVPNSELAADVQRFTVAGSGPNVGLANVTVRPAASPAGRWVVEGDVHASDVDPGTTVDVQVRYRSVDATTALPWAETEVEVDRDGPATFDVTVDLPGTGWVEVRTLQGGTRPADDAVWHVVDPGTVPTRVAVVGPPDPAVLAALTAIDGVRTVPVDALPTERDAPPFDMVIATGPGVERPNASVLWLGEPPSTYLRDAAISTTTPRTVAPGHPLMREVDATDLGLDTVTPLRLPDGARPLVSMEGDVLAWSRTTDVGRQVAVGFGTDDGDWAARPSFPAFVASFVAWARSTPVSEGWTCAVARPCPLPTSAYGGGWRIVDASGDTMATGDALYGVEEAGIDRVWPPGAFSHAFTPTRAGPYELRFADGTVVPLAAHGATVLDQRGSVDADGASGRPLPDVARDRWSAWRWLLAIAAGLLLLDAVIVLRDARRAWAGPASAPSTRWLAGVALGVGAVLPALMALALVPSLLATPAATWVSIRTPWSGAVPTEGGPFGRRATWRTVDVVVGSPVVDSASWQPRTDAVVATLPEAIEVGVALHRGSGPLHVDARALDTRDVPVEDAVAWRRRVAGGSTTVRVPAAAQVAPSASSSLRIDVPDAPRAGGAYALDVAFAPRTSATSLDVVDARGQVVHEVELSAGARRTTVRLQAASEGVETHVLRRWGADTESERAVLSEAKVVANVGPPVHVLAVASSDAVGEALVDALRTQRVEVDRIEPRRLPATREGFGRYDVVFLVDVPARDVHPFHRELLESFVRDDGGGLVIVGGPNAFGPGGYYSTRLDAVSPLSSLVRDEVPEVAMTFVLDRSGSMNAVEGGATRMDLARSATLEAVELLGERSLAALVAFDAKATRVLPLRSTADVRPFREALGTLVAGGGTSIYPALVEAYDIVAASDAETRHVVVMTDGLSQEGDFEGVLGRIRSLGVDTTFVGIGDATSRGQLSRLAELGGGSLHFARDARALPGILTQEAMLLSADPIEERGTAPVWSEGEPPAFLEGPEDAEVPTLLGYVRTTPKPEASVHLLEEDDDDPLLATWRYGLGHVAAFATEADGPWAGTWTQRASFGPFWSQVARWTASSVPSRPYRLTTSTGPLYVDVVLDVDPSVPMRWAPAVRVRAQPTRDVVAVGVLDRREPGRWTARLPLPPPDATTYVAEVTPPSSFEAGTIQHAFVHRDAAIADAPVADVLDLEAVAPGRRGATAVAVDGGEDARRLFVAPDLRWAGPPRAWSLWATVTFLLGLALRAGGVPGLGRRRRGGAAEP